MKTLRCIVLLLWAGQSPAQSFLNGSFEEHNLDSINCHQTCEEVNIGVAYTYCIDYRIGLISQECIFPFTSDYWGTSPQEGNWSMISEGKYHPADPPDMPNPGSSRSAFSLALDAPLDTTKTYKLSYYLKGFPVYPPYPSEDIHAVMTSLGSHPDIESYGVKIGSCPLRDSFGSTAQEYHTSILSPSPEEWTYQSFTFQPTQAHAYIYCQMNVPVSEEYRRFSCFVDNFVLSEVSALDEASASASLSVYPNPFTDIIHIESSGVRLAVYDVLGKLQHQHNLAPNEKTSVNVSDLPMGIYVLKVFDAFGEELGSEKLVKTR